jgi:LemA protein
MAKAEVKEGMKTSTKVWIGVGIVVLLLIFWVITGYNSLVGLNQDVKSKWSEVENNYQTQADKINLLIPIVSSAVSTETKFVKDVIAARTAYLSATTPLARDTAGQQMNNGITALVSAVAENYPTLQANKQYTGLMDELAGAQNRITVARGRYIQSVQALNTAVIRFPTNIIAGMFGITQVEYYKAQSGTTTPPIGNVTLP